MYQNSRAPRSAAVWLNQRWKWVLSIAIFVTVVFLFRYSPSKEKPKPAPPYTGPRESLREAGDHGFLPLSEAREVCQQRRWEPYATRDQRRKVYDLFLINTELDFLEIRLNELDKEVDYFVILESGILPIEA